MRFIIFFFLFVLLTIRPVLAEEDLDAKIKENCQVKWRSDYQMIKYCIDQQYEAWGKVSARLKKYSDDSEERKIINRCAGKWRGKMGGFDFTMVEYCSDNQLKAYRSLQ